MTDTTTNTDTTAQHADQLPDPTDEEVRGALSAESRLLSKQLKFGLYALSAFLFVSTFGILWGIAMALDSMWPALYAVVFAGVAYLFLSFAIAEAKPDRWEHRLLERVGQAPDETLADIKRELVYGDSGGDER